MERTTPPPDQLQWPLLPRLPPSLEDLSVRILKYPVCVQLSILVGLPLPRLPSQRQESKYPHWERVRAIWRNSNRGHRPLRI